MKKIFFMAAASLMLTAISCSEDKTQELPAPQPPIENPEGPLETLEVTVEQQDDTEIAGPQQADTRTTLSGTNVIWTAGEKIRVFNKANTAQSGEYTLKTGAGTANATFEGTTIPGQKYAFYPTSVYNSVSSSTMTFTLPATQVYKANSFADGANPMVGLADANGIIRFKNLCGAIKLKLTGTATINKIVMTCSAGKIAGKATVDAATATPAAAFSDAASKTVTLTVPNVTLTSTATNFYIVVPSGTYAKETVTFEIFDTEGYSFSLKNGGQAITVNRSKVAPLKQIAYKRTVAFPDANFRAVLTGNYGLKATADGTDININDATNKTKFASLTSISANGAVTTHGAIKSLQGIEYFTALTTLSCYWQQLPSLDLSKNTKLVSLDCGSNYITTLTLPATNTVTSLQIADNQISTLDLSKYTALTTLSCFKNKLSALNISAQSSLPIASIAIGTQLNNQTLKLTMTAAQKTAWAAATVVTYNANVSAGFFPDANFRTALTTAGLVMTTDGSDVDMHNTANRTAFTTQASLSASGLKIADLTGHEHFKALTTLSVTNNGTAMKPVDVSIHKGLTTLKFSDCQLTSLDISQNTLLTALDCRNNKLTKLDVSKNPNLTVALACSGNQLSTIDISAITGLTGLHYMLRFGDQKTADGQPLVIAVRIPAACAGQQLVASYNVRTCTAAPGEKFFPDANFRSYLVSSLKMVETNGDIDFANSVNQEQFRTLLTMPCYSRTISSLKGIECFSELTKLDATNNSVAAIDLSQNTKLEFIIIGANQLTSLDVSKNTALQGLYCHMNKLTALNVSMLPSLQFNMSTSTPNLLCGMQTTGTLILTLSATQKPLWTSSGASGLSSNSSVTVL